MIYQWNEKAKYVLFFGLLLLFIFPVALLIITQANINVINIWVNFSYAEMVIPQFDVYEQINIIVYKLMAEYDTTFFSVTIGKVWAYFTLLSLLYSYLGGTMRIVNE
jgi:hypothetical protein